MKRFTAKDIHEVSVRPELKNNVNAFPENVTDLLGNTSLIPISPSGILPFSLSLFSDPRRGFPLSSSQSRFCAQSVEGTGERILMHNNKS